MDEKRPDGQVNILLVDDQPEGLLVLESALAPLGQRLSRAHSGADALRQVLAADFAAILLDVQMPGMDGYETAEAIRSRERSRNTPILFLTAHHTSEVQIFHGYASGAVDFLIKPCSAEILRSKVKVFVELARQSEALKELNQELELLNARLGATNRELEAFSYSVSHDLRAPLRHVNGFLGLLEEHLEGLMDEEGRSYMSRAQGASQRMGQLIDDILGFSRLARQDLMKTRLDLNPLARAVIEEMEPEAGDRKIEWRIGDLPTIQGDPSLLRAAFANLLGNAVKFTGHKPEAVIEMGPLDDLGAEVGVFVRDNGAGFDPAYAHKLFGVFQRLHLDDEFEGTGIGLANVQRIAQRHGGRVWAEGNPGEGATFYLAFPKETQP